MTYADDHQLASGTSQTGGHARRWRDANRELAVDGPRGDNLAFGHCCGGVVGWWSAGARRGCR